ncbi:deoxyribose-phosphate aldolase [Fibrisoma montanum]|uniref:Deoxyribose-phosphate aldolase n=1 Tax=Fibrisoma montanum TaxID=2305895 RepID=A0A418M8F2_9BACT|nr:deoxyribose-phosphate aldolase [Fibrisoma montanum]RIV22370.1 deoxyribose-phosphate aldolase [Fibrisoma montanum]
MHLTEYIDHTNLKPTATETDIRQLCADAYEYQFRTVCVPPSYVLYAGDLLAETPVKVCTVIGFPLGYNSLPIKVTEAEKALEDGATELDMVMNLTRFKSMAYLSVRGEISTLAGLAQSRGALLKVILETAYLDENEIRIACDLCVEAAPDFVKTSTGFAPTGALIDQVRLIRSLLPESIQVKASGGIKTYEQAMAFVEAGATRLGTSSGVAIVQGAS